MKRITAQQAAQKWANKLGASTAEITAGVNAVTTAPGQAAAAQGSFWQQRMMDPKTLAKFEQNVAAVSLPQWQQAMIQKGIPRVGAGATAAIPKMTNFMNQFLPYVQGIAQQVHQMPKGGLANGIARATAQITGNAAFHKQ